MKKRICSMLLALTLALGCAGGVSVRAAEGNIALNRPATASSVANGCGPEIAVDGVKDQASQWNSENMKSGTVADDAPQNEQWLQVDLGVSGAQISQIKLWYNMKVWPMVYRIETTDTPEDPSSWQTVVAVSRPSRNGWVWNGPGQNIADESANTDTITLSSSPRLELTELKRYVRFYVEKVNAQAPGNNVNLREIEIFGTMPGGTQPSYTVRGSALENVIANDGTFSLVVKGASYTDEFKFSVRVEITCKDDDTKAESVVTSKNLTTAADGIVSTKDVASYFLAPNRVDALDQDIKKFYETIVG